MFDDLLKYTSDFKEDEQGWSLVNIGSLSWSPDFVFQGFFNGHLSVSGSLNSNVAFVSAPEEYLGDRSAFYGGTLSYNIAALPEDDAIDAYDVILNSGSTLIGFDLPEPGTANEIRELSFLPSSSVRIIPNTGPGLNISAATSTSHAQATEAQIRAVLGDLDALYIRGEYSQTSSGNAAFTSIDNVQIDATASPVVRVDVLKSAASASPVAAAGTLWTALDIAREGEYVRMSTYNTAGQGWSPFLGGSLFTKIIETDDLTLEGPSQLVVNLFLATGVGDFTLAGDTALADVRGNDLNNRIQGSDQRNVIYGGDGTDILTGGAANDDLFGGDDGDAIYGNGGVDKIYGDGGADALFGGAAADEIFGGGENDTIHGDGGEDELWGDGGNDEVFGGSENDELYGGDGEDVLDGGTGADMMYGDRDNDTYVVDNELDQVIESEDRGDDIVYSSVSYDVPLNVEVLILSGSANLNATGTDSRDQIFGNAGENIINGAGGFDVMQGGAGNDTYAVDNSLDAVIEAAGGGFDNVYSSVDYALDAAQEIESAILTGMATVLRGDDSDNQLFGNDHVNVIDGRGGTDFMLGLGGADIFQINLEAGAQDIVGDFSKAQGDRLAFTGFDQATTFVNQASATSFEVRDTKGTADLADDTVQTFILNDSYGSGTYTQGALEFGVDYYFG